MRSARSIKFVGVGLLLLAFTQIHDSHASPADPFAAGVPTYEATAPKGASYDQGDHGVSEQTGAATYAYPISVAPGRLGAVPGLSLAYSSQAPLRGGLAVGWSLDLPSIQINKEDPGRFHQSLVGSTDLVNTTALGDIKIAPYGGTTGTTYRPETDDSQTRFQRYPASNIRWGSQWVALTPDGTRYFFDSDDTSSDGYSRWNLTRRLDPFGNEIKYTWEKLSLPAGAIDYRIVRVEYNSNSTTTPILYPHAKVEFSYAPLEYCSPSNIPIGASFDFRKGMKSVSGASRVTAIATYVRDVQSATAPYRQVRNYSFSYDATALSCPLYSYTPLAEHASPLRYLTRISETAYSPTAVAKTVPDVVFTYGPRTLNYSPLSIGSPPRYGESGDAKGTQSMMLDLNGDGILDLVAIKETVPTGPDYKCKLLVYHGVGSGLFATAIERTLPTARWAAGATGGPNVPDPGQGERCDLNGQFTKLTNRTYTPGTVCTGVGSFVSYHFLDYNNDGLVDLLTNVWADADNFSARLEPDFDVVDSPPAGVDGYIFMNNAPSDEDVNACDPGSPRPETWGGAYTDPPLTGFPWAGEYKWRLFKNNGNGFNTGHVLINAPLPLQPSGGDVAVDMGYAPKTSLSTLTDIDGDGYLDYIDPGVSPLGMTYDYIRVYKGRDNYRFDGAIMWPIPLLQPSAGGSALPSGWGAPDTETTLNWTSNVSALLRDMNGDGLPDYLIYTSGLFFYRNNGSGFDTTAMYGPGSGVVNTAEVIRTDVTDPFAPGADMISGVRAHTQRLVDVDNDGLVDILRIPSGATDVTTSTGNVQVAFNLGDAYRGFQDLPDPAPPGTTNLIYRRANHQFRKDAPVTGGWHIEQDITDISGDGLPDLVSWTSPTSLEFRSPDLSAGVPRLLRTVNNGRGATVQFNYAASSAYVTMTTHMPAMWVVSSVGVTLDPVFGQPNMTTAYKYADPVFGREKQQRPYRFLGFRKVTIDGATPAGSTDGFLRTVKEYSYDLVPNDPLGLQSEARGYETKASTYASLGGTDTLRSMVMTTWVSEPLFDKPDGTLHTIRFVHKATTEKCTATAANPTCTAGAATNLKTTETWIVGQATTDGKLLPMFYFLDKVDENPASTTTPYRRKDYGYQLRYDGTIDYRQLTESVLGYEWVGGVQTQTSEESTTYDSRGLPIQSTVKLDTTPTYATTARTFDAWGNVDTVKKPVQLAAGSTRDTKYSYNVHYISVATTTNELSHVVSTTIDPGTGATTQKYGPNFKMVVLPGETFPTTVWDQDDWTIDGFGRILTHSVDVDSSAFGYASYLTERFTYTDTATLNMVKEEQIKEYGGAVWKAVEHRYDGLGRSISDTQLITGTDPVTSYVYDTAGLLREIKSPDPRVDTGATVSFFYDHDATGRVTKLVRPDATGVTVAYSGLDKTVTELVTDGSGSSTKGVTDIYGRLVQVLEYDNPDPGVTADTKYYYDDADTLRQVTDADGNDTFLTHDWAGRRTQIQRGTRSWKYEYDRNGNAIKEIGPAPSGTTDFTPYSTVMTYDDLDRVTVKNPARLGMLTTRQEQLGIGNTNFTYDGGAATQHIGELTAVGLYRGATNWANIYYNYEARRLVSKERRVWSVNYLATASGDQTITRTYNALREPTLVKYCDGWMCTNTGIQWQTTYDDRGLAQAIQWYEPPTAKWKDLAVYARSLAGAPRTRTSPLLTGYDQQRTWIYDVLGRPSRDDVTRAGVNKLHREYTYRQSGDLAGVIGTTYDGSANVSANASFTYDKVHRLKTATGPSTYNIPTLTYSKAGNVTRAAVKNVPVWGTRDVSYSYGAVDPQAVDTLVNVSGGATYGSFTYDLAGNMTTRSVPGGLSTYTWDGEDQLREAVAPGAGNTEAYYYDHTGQRMIALNAADGVRFWFNESETKYPVGGGSQTRYVHLGDGGGPVARLQRIGTGTVTMGEFQYSDALQNLTLSLSAAGAVTGWFHYGAFGEVVASVGSPLLGTHRRQFNGKENDVRTELRYYGARYYDALTMRWISGDPLFRFAPDIGMTEPQRQNLYLFTGNNPLRYIDADGRVWSWATTVLGGVGGAAIGLGYSLVTEGVSAVKGDGFHLGAIARSTAKGAVTGAAAGAVLGAVTGDPTALTAATLGAAAVAGFGSGVLAATVDTGYDAAYDAGANLGESTARWVVRDVTQAMLTNMGTNAQPSDPQSDDGGCGILCRDTPEVQTTEPEGPLL